MEKSKIKFAATTVFTVNGGIETEAIVSDGSLFIRVADVSSLGIGGGTAAPSDKEDAAPKKSPSKAPAEEKSTPAKKTPGKGTPTKKAEETPDNGGEEEELIDQVIGILTDLDQGQNNAKKATERLMALEGISEDASAKQVRALVDSFEADPKSDMAESADLIAKMLSGEEPEPEPAPAKKGTKTTKAAETTAKTKTKTTKKEPEPEPEPEGNDDGDNSEEVEIGDLEEGDEVAVWFDANDEWYTGTVSKVTKKGVFVTYDDDNEELQIDPDLHTEIRRYPKED